MAASLTEGWKVPMAHFPTTGLQGEECANLVSQNGVALALGGDFGPR